MTGNTLEQRARELLAAEYRDSDPDYADAILSGEPIQDEEETAIRAIEAALRLSAGADWQPIETAPKDGSAFLGCSDHMLDTEGHPLMWACRFDGYMGYFRSNTDHEPLYDLTHWQPLPAAPTLADEGES